MIDAMSVLYVGSSQYLDNVTDIEALIGINTLDQIYEHDSRNKVKFLYHGTQSFA